MPLGGGTAPLVMVCVFAVATAPACCSFVWMRCRYFCRVGSGLDDSL